MEKGIVQTLCALCSIGVIAQKRSVMDVIGKAVIRPSTIEMNATIMKSLETLDISSHIP